MIEIIGVISTIIAIAGVLANNRRIRWCFLLWIASNAMSLMIHADAAIWSLAARDAVFIVLAFEGWFKWKRK